MNWPWVVLLLGIAWAIVAVVAMGVWLSYSTTTSEPERYERRY